MIHVFGHKHPDSDSICSALVIADWLNGQGSEATPWRLGELRTETQFILAQAGADEPALLTHALEGEQVWLVDFSDLEQGPADLSHAKVIGLVDHHRLGSLVTDEPLDAWIRAVGSSCTIAYELLSQQGPVTRRQARLMLGAIMSDTLCLTSPTTTAQDILTCERLAPLAEVSLAEFGQQVLMAKTDLGGLTPAMLLRQDEKAFQAEGLNFIISQIEVGSEQQVAELLPALLADMARRCEEERLDFFALMVTDLSAVASRLYFTPHEKLPVEPCSLPGVVSRKKQGLPWVISRLAKV
ncbi:DHH family phosphoesterase [Aeromonas cavernicola]|uniref:inorganic diphosphatase n=1 Tax=Aeromonas cavernicola TaxID=1006623 RepID=A0A2H9U4J5_9GAMM|nr:DHHA2 domain-containing protein [Aeromonas cavernicola]PJG58924.1 pyrophosphatase [Aeromonas cavernicola]